MKNQPKRRLPPFVQDQLKEEVKHLISLDLTPKKIIEGIDDFLIEKGFAPLSAAQCNIYMKRCRADLVEDLKSMGKVNINKSLNAFNALKKAALKKGDVRAAIKCEEHVAKISGLLDDQNDRHRPVINIEYTNANEEKKGDKQ